MHATINAIGIYHPEKEVDNSFFESSMETSDQWIRKRTGIERRFFAAPDEHTSDMCVKAALALSAKFKKDLSDVDFIIVATTTPDHTVPSVASQVQARLNIPDAGATDISSACAGFCNGLILAKGLIAAETHKKILVFGADTLSEVTDFTDRTTCVLFGDAAGVVLVEASTENNIFNALTGADGNHGKDLYLAHQNILINNVPATANGKLHQNGKAVYKWAIQTLSKGLQTLATKNNMSLNDISFFLPHSANYRLLEAVFSELNLPMNRCLDSVRQYGNTSAASIPLAWYEGLKENKIQPGDTLILMGFGGGFTYGGLCLRNQIDFISL